VDLDAFWRDEEIARNDAFGAEIPQFPLGIRMSGECVYAELGLEEDRWRYDHDETWRLELNRAYNDRAEEIVGRRLLNEKPAAPGRQWPGVRQIGEVMGGRNEWRSESWWLMPFASDEDGLKAALDRVDALDVRSAMLPENWDEEKERMGREHPDVAPPQFRSFRGPVTLAATLYDPEKLIWLILENEALAERYRDTILRVALEMADVLDREAGDEPGTVHTGFWFADDLCCLLTPDMYRFFGYPILKALFERYAPDPSQHARFQHSDSAMGHLLPLLGELELTAVNFGPTVRFAEIREHLPRAVVQGTLSPITFMNNDEEAIIAEVRRDFEEARETRGLLVATAGSINNGSRLTSMRAVMHAIQTYGRL
jgi:uroporphyrinogen decarboxylase